MRFMNKLYLYLGVFLANEVKNYVYSPKILEKVSQAHIKNEKYTVTKLLNHAAIKFNPRK